MIEMSSKIKRRMQPITHSPSVYLCRSKRLGLQFCFGMSTLQVIKILKVSIVFKLCPVNILIYVFVRKKLSAFSQDVFLICCPMF